MIRIISVGKVKNSNLDSLISYYQKQVPRKIELINIKDEPRIDGLEKEGNKIIKVINPNDFVVVLAIKGEMFSSEELALKINELEVNNNSNLTFVIGGSFGLSNEVNNRADLLISFSKMTFPHQLMLLILMEQIYRAYSITNKHPYHK